MIFVEAIFFTLAVAAATWTVIVYASKEPTVPPRPDLATFAPLGYLSGEDHHSWDFE